MIELLEFIFRDEGHFFGTLFLLYVFGEFIIQPICLVLIALITKK